jgi:hypothetical protein
MKQKRKVDIDFSKLGINPFVSSLRIPAGKYGVELQDGKIREYEFDKDVGFKVFVANGRREMFAGLGYRSLQIWMWVMASIKTGEDYIWLNYTMMMEETGITTERTIREALKELYSKGFMAPCVKEKGVYWINPERAFKGNRINKYPDKVEWQ